MPLIFLPLKCIHDKGVHISLIYRTCGNGDKQRYRSCPSTDGCGSEKTKDSLKCKLKECLPKFGKFLYIHKFNEY